MLSLVQASEVQLASREDRYMCRGKSLILQSFGAPLSNLLLSPATGAVYGSRMTSINSVYSRYRLIKLLFRFCAPFVSSGQNLYIGVQDDSGTDSDNPTTQADIIQLRCSTVMYGTVTQPTEFEWKPIDKEKWYYTSSEIGGDPRFLIPAVLWFSTGVASSTLTGEIHYTIEFAGAIDAS